MTQAQLLPGDVPHERSGYEVERPAPPDPGHRPLPQIRTDQLPEPLGEWRQGPAGVLTSPCKRLRVVRSPLYSAGGAAAKYGIWLRLVGQWRRVNVVDLSADDVAAFCRAALDELHSLGGA